MENGAPNIPEQGVHCPPSGGDENTCGSKCPLCEHPHYLSMCEWGRGAGRRGFPWGLSFIGASMAQHVGVSGLLICQLMTGNPGYKATCFWSWKILRNLVSIWPSISCQVLSHVPAVPKLGHSPLGYTTWARRPLNKPHGIWKDSPCLPPWLPMRFQHGIEENGFTYA